MFAAVPMLRVRIQVPQREGAAATQAIARLGFLHLIDIAHGRSDTIPPGTDRDLTAHRSVRIRARRTAERLGIGAPPLVGRIAESPIADFGAELREIESALAPLEANVDAAWGAKSLASADAAEASRNLNRARRVERGGLDVDRLRVARFVGFRIASGMPADFDTVLTALAPTPCAVVPLDVSPSDVLAAIAAPASAMERVDAALRLVQVEVTSPAAATALASSPAIEASLRDARTREAQAMATLERLRAEHGPTLLDLLCRVETCVLLLQAQTHFAATGRFVVISGWIPEHALDQVRRALASSAPDAVVDVERPGDQSADTGALGIPLLHRNPLLLRPFQPLIDLYGTPQYREVQPTAFFAVSFLLMFGLMFGDVGHGAVLATAGYCLFRFVPRFLDYGILLGEAGIVSAIFGVLYGSVFGVEGVLPVLWLPPLHDLPSFMRVAVGLGAVLISLGLVLNVVNCWRAGERLAALLSPRGLFGAFMYWTALALAVRAFASTLVVPMWLIWSLAAAAAATVLLGPAVVLRLSRGHARQPAGPRAPRWLRLLEGVVELVDTMFSFFANTVSFVRIGAFAAVHAGIFVAMFAVTDVLAQVRFGGPLSIAVLVVGNVLVILLEGLTVSVQVLRLEYYEFFGKFFRGGGELYRPLMLRPTQQGGAS